MWRTRWMSICGAAVLVLAMLWMPAFAQTAETPAPAFGEWITLQPGEHVVLPFHYAAQAGRGGIDCTYECRDKEGHHAEKDCMKNCGEMNHSTHLQYSPFKIELFTQDMKAKPVSFNVLRTEDLAQYAKTGKHEGIGAGSANKYLKSQLSWEGYFMCSGTDYVVVAADYNATAPVTVKLALNGPGVN